TLPQMPTMHSPAAQCCLCVVGVLMFVLGLIMMSIGICLILNFGIWENALDIPDFDTEEGKKKVGIILTCVGLLAMLVSISVSVFYLCTPPPGVPKLSKGQSTVTNGPRPPGDKHNLQKLSHGVQNPDMYSRQFTKPPRKKKNRKIIKPRLDKIAEAASRKASEADLASALYDDERPDSQTSQSTQTKDTTDSELTSDQQDPSRKIPVIIRTTPSEHDPHSPRRKRVSDTPDYSETNDDDDVFSAPPPDEHVTRINVTNAMAASEINSLASESTSSGIGFGDVENKMPDIESLFKKRLPLDLSAERRHYESAETLSIEEAEDENTIETTRVHDSTEYIVPPITFRSETEEKNIQLENNSVNGFVHDTPDTKTKDVVSPDIFQREQQVHNLYESSSEQTNSFPSYDSVERGDLVTGAVEKTDNRAGWYIGPAQAEVSSQSDYSLSHNDNSYLLKDETGHRNSADNCYSQDYIPSD
ncbi:hypothetical protein ScPMuIL_004225, partial [Solemya velum]